MNSKEVRNDQSHSVRKRWHVGRRLACRGVGTSEDGRQEGDSAQDEARSVGDGDGPVTPFLEEGVDDPEQAVDAGHGRLDGGALLAGQVHLDLRQVGHVHADGSDGGDDAQDAGGFCREFHGGVRPSECSPEGDEAQHDAGGVGQRHRDVALRLEQRVDHPQGAVDGGHQRLQGAAFLAGQVHLDLGDVGDVHRDCRDRGDGGQDLGLPIGQLHGEDSVGEGRTASFC